MSTKTIVRCSVCKKIEDDGRFRMAWPGEISGEIKEIYCKECAELTLKRVQNGDFAVLAEKRARRLARA